MRIPSGMLRCGTFPAKGRINLPTGFKGVACAIGVIMFIGKSLGGNIISQLCPLRITWQAPPCRANTLYPAWIGTAAPFTVHSCWPVVQHPIVLVIVSAISEGSTLPFVVSKKFLAPMTGYDGLFEIRVEYQSNIYRIFCCFDRGQHTKDT